ncbi:MAG TPA: hypothetical protein DDW23_03445 [Planctomycetes bacterium]|nr:hypothetical protein [Planctomycetota bacterium]
MINNAIAVVVGLAVGMAVNMGLVVANMALFPAPEGFNWEDPVVVSEYLAALPILAFLIVLAAHLGQAFVGGWVAAKISKANPMGVALTVGALSLAGGIMNMMQLPHPTWMWIEMPLYLVVAWAAGNLERSRRQAI